MRRAYVGLGGNVGGPEAVIGRMQHAIHQINGLAGVAVVGVSAVYDTAPVGPVSDQPAFLNAVVALEVDDEVSPVALLAELLRIEAGLGRDRAGARFQGPRPIDLDLLVLGDERVEDRGPPPVILPHPRMHERAFVLRPLAELAGEDLVIAGVGRLGDCLRAPPVAAQRATRSELELTAPD